MHSYAVPSLNSFLYSFSSISDFFFFFRHDLLLLVAANLAYSQKYTQAILAFVAQNIHFIADWKMKRTKKKKKKNREKNNNHKIYVFCAISLFPSWLSCQWWTLCTCHHLPDSRPLRTKNCIDEYWCCWTQMIKIIYIKINISRKLKMKKIKEEMMQRRRDAILDTCVCVCVRVEDVWQHDDTMVVAKPKQFTTSKWWKWH